uniref:hypothetical protein n=1 Tax=Pseudoerythrocladia kornmannii TaxID=753682 RepID=UPI001BEDEFFB|nr:hypothetical protein MW575_pgp118 [Pseudoerythrocladia kornmannii]QUE28237.1 Ycf86 [Pseudoerythrocladia kornmannii]UNJ16742.1 hypothetical protein [Pseudoerythrocladia kornmannii]
MTKQKKQNVSLGQSVKIIQLLNSNCSDVNLKLGRQGIIRSLKLTQNNCRILIIEFKDNTRIWFFEGEIDLI